MKHSNAVGLLMITGLMWGLGGVFIKLIPWSPLAIAGLRSGIAGLTILMYLKRPHFNWSKYQMGAALAYAATVSFFVTASKLTTAGNAVLIQYTAPVYVGLFSNYFLKEKTNKSDWISVILILVGLILFFMDDLSTRNTIGNIFALSAGISFATFTILCRKQKDASPAEAILLGNFITLIISIPSIFTQVTFQPQSWFLIILLGVIQLGIPYILYSIAIKYVTALDAIIYPTIEPIVNPILVYIFIGEKLGHWAIGGGALVMSSVIIRAYFQNVRKTTHALVGESSSSD